MYHCFTSLVLSKHNVMYSIKVFVFCSHHPEDGHMSGQNILVITLIKLHS